MKAHRVCLAAASETGTEPILLLVDTTIPTATYKSREANEYTYERDAQAVVEVLLCLPTGTMQHVRRMLAERLPVTWAIPERVQP